MVLPWRIGSKAYGPWIRSPDALPWREASGAAASSDSDREIVDRRPLPGRQTKDIGPHETSFSEAGSTALTVFIRYFLQNEQNLQAVGSALDLDEDALWTWINTERPPSNAAFAAMLGRAVDLDPGDTIDQLLAQDIRRCPRANPLALAGTTSADLPHTRNALSVVAARHLGTAKRL